MSIRKTTEERESQIKSICSAKGFIFVGWVDGYTNAYSKIICKCPSHGNWAVSVHNFVNGGRGCPGCQKDATSARCRSPELEVVRSINDKREGYHFVKWTSVYEGTKSKFICQCPIHGPWKVSVLHYLHNGTGCPSCAGLKPFSKAEREKQIHSCCAASGLYFVGWVGEYKNSNSRFEYKCPTHGNNEVSVNTFINSGTRCPSCSLTGFNKDASAGLYAIQEGSWVKVGVSNNPEERLAILKRKTPFSFSLIGVHYGDGRDILYLEKYFHAKYQNAGLTGFDGATEWLENSEELLAELNEVFHV